MVDTSRAARAKKAADERRQQAKAGEVARHGEASAELAASDAKVARAILNPMIEQIEAQLPRQISPEAFIRASLTMLQDGKRGRDLMGCSRPSLYKALLDSARYGLMPGTDEGAIVVYGSASGPPTAQFIPQYQGLIKMFWNSGMVEGVVAKLIYRKDYWSEEYGDGRGFIHRPYRFEEDGTPVPRGDFDADGKPCPASEAVNPAILAYCYVRLKDGGRTEVEIMSRQEAIEIRDRRSRSYQNAERSWNGAPPKRNSTWHTDFDAMWLKSVIRRAAKYAPKSPELLSLLLADNDADGIVGQPAPQSFTPGGPAAAWEGDVDYGRGTVIPGTAERDPSDAAGGAAERSGGEPPGDGEPRRPRRQAAGTAEPGSASEAWDQTQ